MMFFRAWQRKVRPAIRRRSSNRRADRLRVESLEVRDLLSGTKIAQENALPGAPESEWELSNPSTTIEGYAADFSVNLGETVRFKVRTDATDYRIDIYRLGYYGGTGARKVATVQPQVSLPQAQPAGLSDPATGLNDFGNWQVSASWQVPSTATSGIYLGKLEREDGVSGSSYMIFVVRDDDGGSDLLFQTSDTTWQAYNNYGGTSLYQSTGNIARGYKVSYNRPFAGLSIQQLSSVFRAELPMLYWLEANGYDVSYSTGIDTDRRGSELLEHKAFLSVGHDEYWSAGQRSAVEAARNAGVNLAFFSGNEVFWKTRWESSIDGTGEPYKTLVAYKETHANAKIDPIADQWTGTWRDPRFSPPADGGRPENSLTGTLFAVNNSATSTTAITVPADYAQLRLWRNTSVALLQPGQTATLAAETLGFEWDVVADNPSRPAGLFRLSSTTRDVPVVLIDQGSSYAPGTATHSLTMYRASSGALVFGAGTIQWSWGLGGKPNQAVYVTSPAMQQATVNLLADMGSQPQTLSSGLVLATASNDSSAPTATLTSPLQLTPQQGIVTVAGTASDTGGIVAGVEVSVDGGQTWSMATGKTSWSYSWTPKVQGAVTVKVRAVDDSGNLETPGPGTTVQVQAAVTSVSIWSNNDLPAIPFHQDGIGLELGMKFRAATTGLITGIRYYQGTLADTAWHIGHLWSSTGTNLATVMFPPAKTVGWQQAQLSQPVRIAADTTYVVSQFSPLGYYPATLNYFTTSYTNGPLKALATGEDGPNGMFGYNNSQFPKSSVSSNYWVDVLFAADSQPAPSDDSQPPISSIVEVSSTSGVTVGQSVRVAGTARDQGVGNVSQVEISIDGGATWQLAAGTKSWSYTFVPTSAGKVNVFSRATDTYGNVEVPTAGYTISVSGNGSYTMWDAVLPTTAGSFAGPALEVGMKFQPLQSGRITELRYYQASNVDSSAHIGNLWSSSGQLLATVTFPGLTGKGWRQVQLSQPVAVEANQTYIVSQYSPTGTYAATLDYFTAAQDKGPLRALRNGDDGGNGVYRYGSTSSFPNASFRSANYWVDVAFQPDPTAPISTWSLWQGATPTSLINRHEATPIQLGMKFQVREAGVVETLRYYQAQSADTTSHVGRLWTASGQLLGTVTFAAATKTGWQEARLDTPVRLQPNTTYVVTHYTPQGYYSATLDYFTSSRDSGPVHALANGEDGPNGLYRYGSDAFPTSSYRAANYWADLVFRPDSSDTQAPSSTIAPPSSNLVLVGQPVTINGTASDTGGGTVSKVEISIDGGSTWALATGTTSWTYTWTPLTAGAVQVKSRATDSFGNVEIPAAGIALTVTQNSVSVSLWNNPQPTGVFKQVPQQVDVGMKFQATTAGQVTAIRYYQPTLMDTQAHVGRLWSSSGQLLATVNFSAATQVGWQQAQLSNPVTLQPNTTYIVSVLSPSGIYAESEYYFTQSWTNDALVGLSSQSAGGNGVISTGSQTAQMPTASSNSANYWVDVVFRRPAL
ncbi:MAG: DUF4082 domain-containing protein [Pirellulales bacterium]